MVGNRCCRNGRRRRRLLSATLDLRPWRACTTSKTVVAGRARHPGPLSHGSLHVDISPDNALAVRVRCACQKFLVKVGRSDTTAMVRPYGRPDNDNSSSRTVSLAELNRTTFRPPPGGDRGVVKELAADTADDGNDVAPQWDLSEAGELYLAVGGLHNAGVGSFSYHRAAKNEKSTFTFNYLFEVDEGMDDDCLADMLAGRAIQDKVHALQSRLEMVGVELVTFLLAYYRATSSDEFSLPWRELCRTARN